METIKKVAMVTLVAAVVCLGTGRSSVFGADVTISLDVASAYVFRGSTFNDELVAQPGLEISGLPVVLGVWGNFDIGDYDNTLEEREFSEIDFYASYEVPLKLELVSLSVGYTEYMYPTGAIDADRELSLGASFNVLLSPSLTIYYGMDGGIQKNVYVEAGVSHDIELNEKVTLGLEAALGYLSPDEGEDGLTHYTVSAGLSYDKFSASVTYVGQGDDDVLPDVDDGGTYDVKVFGTIGVAYDF